MAQLQQQGVKGRVSGVLVPVDGIHNGVESYLARKDLRCEFVEQVVLKGKMAPLAALIASGGDPLMADWLVSVSKLLLQELSAP